LAGNICEDDFISGPARVQLWSERPIKSINNKTSANKANNLQCRWLINKTSANIYNVINAIFLGDLSQISSKIRYI
jgi:hypothetical protein